MARAADSPAKAASSKKKKEPTKPLKQGQLSADIVVDSDSEEEITESNKKQSIQSKKSTAESNESSEDDLPELSQISPQASSKTKKPVNNASNSSTVSSSSDEEEDEDEEDTNPPTTSSTPQPTRTSQHSAQQTRSTYIPPSGYTKLSRSDNSPLLNSSDLKSKQLFHITIPSNLNPSDLTSSTIQSLFSTTKKCIMNDVEYSSTTDTSLLNENKCVLLPNKDQRYISTTMPISKTIHIRQQISLPALRHGGIAESVDTAPRQIRAQPKGLRMRYTPPGFGNGPIGKMGVDTDSEDEVADDGAMTGFKRSRHTIDDGEIDQARSKKKSRKSKEKQKSSQVEESQDLGQVEDVEMVDVQSNNQETDLISHADGGKDMDKDAKKTEGEEQEARRRRKAEKKLTKERKSSKKVSRSTVA